MKKVRHSNENEMVYEFLKMEISSGRYSEKILNILQDMQIGKNIVVDGNISDEQENALRTEIMGRFRGYKKNSELFENFPVNIDWYWTVFDNADISKIIYINYSYWNEISNYTGSPVEAAKTILSGRTIYDVPNDGFFEALKFIEDGNIFPPIIMLTDKSESRYIILEGHCRMTAYGLKPELFSNVSVLLGYCEDSELKAWYGEMSGGEE